MECVDVKAPGEGVFCGPCPTGFTGDGKKCLGNQSIQCSFLHIKIVPEYKLSEIKLFANKLQTLMSVRMTHSVVRYASTVLAVSPVAVRRGTSLWNRQDSATVRRTA